jgi:hypothetical protein
MNWQIAVSRTLCRIFLKFNNIFEIKKLKATSSNRRTPEPGIYFGARLVLSSEVNGTTVVRDLLLKCLRNP